MRLLELKNISKSFGKIKSLDNVDFHVNTGEVVGLLGDNGAGKSTLIKIIMGYIQPDNGGEIYWKEKKLKKYSVSDSHKLGIEVVYQERALAEGNSVWRNLFMGREIVNKLGLLCLNKMREETRQLMSDMKFTSKAITPDGSVKTLSGGERQGIAISRALYFDAELIILDEPTMGLSLSETKKTLDFVRKIKNDGRSAIFIDHNIFHVFPVADRIIILDRGKVVGEFSRGQISLEKLTEQLHYVAENGVLR